jgi:hypothetical protein
MLLFEIWESRDARCADTKDTKLDGVEVAVEFQYVQQYECSTVSMSGLMDGIIKLLITNWVTWEPYQGH